MARSGQLVESSLALLWQILSGAGFPNQFFCDSWVVGFWRGRPWLVGRRIGKKSLDAFSSRFWVGWVTRRGDKCVHSTCRGRSVLAIARAFSRWRSGLHLANTINCTTSLPRGVWDATPVETELLVQADRLVGGSDAVLVIDDTAIPKKGTHSVGVAAQYASALGKTANCQ